MTTQEVMMTMGNRENFMCQWFQWLPPELKILIMKKIPYWKRELEKGDFVKFKMNIPVYESYKWNESFRRVYGVVTNYIFNQEKSIIEYCFELCDESVYHSNEVQKSVFWRPIGDELEVYKVKDEAERETLFEWHTKITIARNYWIGHRKSRRQRLPRLTETCDVEYKKRRFTET